MKCEHCNNEFHEKCIGRLPRYCSNACRQAAYRFRKGGYVHRRVSAALALRIQKQSLTLC